MTTTAADPAEGEAAADDGGEEEEGARRRRQNVTTVNGATFTVNVADDGSVSLTDAAGNDVAVVTTDIETSNGVIHVIDAVLMPT